MIAVAVVCVGVIAVAGMFLPSQAPQQVTENKTWQFKQYFYGASDENIWINVEADVWHIAWYTNPVENLYDGVPWPISGSYFGIHVYSDLENILVARGYSLEGVPLSGTDYIIRGGEFRIQIITRDIDDWHLYIYEYR